MGQSWDASEKWYSSCVGEKGHYYHQTVVLPNVLRLLGTCGSLLDLGCGSGVLARHLPKEVQYVGVDLSKALLATAKKMSPQSSFFQADATSSLPLEKRDFDSVIFLLSLQNMERGERALQTASHHLKKGGKLLLVLNHPCFRIPRQSSWQIDEQMKLQYRRINGYLSSQEIPIQTHPSKREKSETTYSYHHSLSDLFSWLSPYFSVLGLEEWISDKKSEGTKAKMEDRARREFPLFLTLIAKKER